MSLSANNRSDSRSTRGGTVARVLLILLGSVLTLFGALLVIATIGVTLDGDPDILFLAPFALATTVGGIFIIASQVSAKRLEGKTETGGGERMISSQPIPTPEPTISTPDPQPAPSSPAEDVAHLVFRSEDLFATLRDLVRHESTSLSGKYHLATMLKAAGVMDWTDAPSCEGGRLSRNTHFWIRMGVDGLSPRQYDTLVSAEAALSVNQDLPDVRTFPVSSREAEEACLKLMRTMVEQTVARPELTDEGLRACYHHTNDNDTPGEWVVRSQICNAAECLRTPFRVVYDLRANVANGLVVLSLEIPRPGCMAIFAENEELQAGLARAYAFRLGVLVASNAFSASDRVQRVVVNCHEHDSSTTLVSMDIDRSVMASLRKVAGGSMIETGFPADNRVRASFDGRWFAPVDPFLSLDDPEASPFGSRTYPELDTREAPSTIWYTCQAKRICDLGINENASRIAAWDDINRRLGTTTEQAASVLVAMRDHADDITVAEACNRTLQALVNGEIEHDDTEGLAKLFIDGSSLDRAVARSAELLEDGHEDPETAVKVLQAALAPIDDMGAYLDDETTAYRYFGSVSERIHHNRVIDEGERQITLVPDAYFNAHSNLSIALGMLGRNEEALAHADVCRRLAPTSTYATMRKVRVLESESRIYEAADLIIDALQHAVTPRDAAICHYRLAYMEWKLGREDLAAACYQRSLSWDTEMASQAREELDDLLSSSPNLERPTAEQADALLAREGIPLGCVRTDGERTLAAAVACMDNGALISARPLLAVLFGMNNDDVVMGVYRSLNVWV